MKNLITFLLYCLSVTALVAQAQSESSLEVISKSPTETTLRLQLSGVEQIQVATPAGPASVIQIGNGTQLLEKGAPDLPKIATSLLIPRSGNMAVEILHAEYDDYYDVVVAPSKGDLKRNVDPASIPYKYGDAYQQDAFYPAQTASLQTPFVMRDARGLALWICPVQYNPVSKVMRVYKNITLRVYHAGGTGENELKAPGDRPFSRTFMDVYEKLFLNFNASWLERGPESPEKMLVITNDAFVADLEPLITWKRQSGIHTTVVTMSEVGLNNADNIYNFVKDYYTNEGITYLMLVGDQNAIDPQMRPSGGTPYSCDNCFGYMDGDDHYPEVFVGRYNATTLDHLNRMVSRNLEYETAPLVDTALNWCATGMASASNEGQGIGDDDQADFEHSNEWKTKHLADGYEKYWEFYDGNHSGISPTPGDESADQPGNPQNTALVNLMNTRGVSLYNYTGHGWEQGLVSGNFNTTAVSNLRNHHRYPIVIAVACCAGNFTNNGGGDCLGEAIQRAGDPVTGETWGSIGGFFSSDYQSWAPPMEGQDGMNQYLVDADGVTLRPNISAMAAYGNALMIAAYQQGGEVMADFWNPFHEPSLMPRTKLPQALAMNYLPTVFLGSTSLSVNCDVEGALVSLYWQGQTLAVGIVENGVAVLNFPALSDVGDLTVTVTQFNHIPQQGIIKVEPAGGPYVITEAITLDDAAGNNNQQADFAENILLNVDLANVGVVPATGTTLTLSTTDDNVVITDNEEIVGDLDDSLSISLPGAFAFSVNDDVVDGHVVSFNLHIEFSDTLSLDIPLNVNLKAPELNIAGIQIDDSAGNNNKRFDSGETVLVTITNLNLGASTSPDALGTLSSASPYLNISAPVQLGPIDALTGSVAAQFSVTVAPDAPPVTSAMFQYQVGAGNYLAEKEFGPYLINAIIEDFETNTFTEFPWTMGGNKPWIISYTEPYDGLSCARSGSISHTQKTRMFLTIDVTTPGNISFARKVASEANFDKLKFFIDNVEQVQWSGLLPWEEVSFPLDAGIHTLLWSYEKDNYGSDNGDRAWVDNISLPPHVNVVGTKNPTDIALDLGISPNPAHDQALLNFELPREQTLRIEVLDLLGRTVGTVQTATRFQQGAHTLPVDLSRLAPGIYLVRLQSAEGVNAVKVLKD